MSMLDRLWCRMCRKCPIPDIDDTDDLRRLERAQAYLRLAQRDTDIALRYERDMSTKRRRENDTPQGKGGR